MRILGTIPHSEFRIVVYELESHLYTEFEAGPMKQGYKWPKSKFSGIPAVQALMDPSFLQNVKTRFSEMYADMSSRIPK